MKTSARELLRGVLNDVEILCLNGGALFHDFQMALEGFTSVPLNELNVSMERIEKSCKYVVDWLVGYKVKTPAGSIVKACEDRGIDVLMFTAQSCDYWQMYLDDTIKKSSLWLFDSNFKKLRDRFMASPFHYLNICSAVIGPEVFQKAIQGVPFNHIRADVVDFFDMYRPRTRVAKYGHYYQMEVSEFMKVWKKNSKILKVCWTEGDCGYLK